MDFLHTPNNDEDRIILVLVLARRHHIHILCYDWRGIDSPPRLSERRLPADFTLPNLLIPLTKPFSFVMINNTSVVMFDNVFESDMTYPEEVIPLALTQNESGRYPLYTQWARPFRNKGYKRQYDNIYLCSEDGLLFYLEIGHNGVIERHILLGQLDCDVDAAFDVLDYGFKGGDVLLVAGSMGGGGLYLQKARQCPECVQKFANWTPTMDSVMITVNQGDGNEQNEQTLDDLFFVSSGSSNGKGAIVQLRHGIEAAIGLVIPLGDSGLKTRNVWVMSTQDDSRTYLLTSTPVSSAVLSILPSPEHDGFSAANVTDIAFDFVNPTLAAGKVLDEIMVQVTSRAIYLSHLPPSEIATAHFYEDGQSVVLSVISNCQAFIASIAHTKQGFLIIVNSVHSDEKPIEVIEVAKSGYLDHQPTAISIAKIYGRTCIVIGTRDATLSVYAIIGTEVLQIGECTLRPNGDEISKAVESIILLESTPAGHSQTYVLFCGLRCGDLVGVSLRDYQSPSGNRIGATFINYPGESNVV